MATSIPTPQIAHFTEEDYRDIYEPAEDSFILLDALEKDADLIRLTEPTLSVEIGLVIQRNTVWTLNRAALALA